MRSDVAVSNLSSWNLNDQLQILSSSSIFEIPQLEVEVEVELDLKSSIQAMLPNKKEIQLDLAPNPVSQFFLPFEMKFR